MTPLLLVLGWVAVLSLAFVTVDHFLEPTDMSRPTTGMLPDPVWDDGNTFLPFYDNLDGDGLIPPYGLYLDGNVEQGIHPEEGAPTSILGTDMDLELELMLRRAEEGDNNSTDMAGEVNWSGTDNDPIVGTGCDSHNNASDTQGESTGNAGGDDDDSSGSKNESSIKADEADSSSDDDDDDSTKEDGDADGDDSVMIADYDAYGDGSMNEDDDDSHDADDDDSSTASDDSRRHVSVEEFFQQNIPGEGNDWVTDSGHPMTGSDSIDSHEGFPGDSNDSVTESEEPPTKRHKGNVIGGQNKVVVLTEKSLKKLKKTTLKKMLKLLPDQPHVGKKDKVMKQEIVKRLISCLPRLTEEDHCLLENVAAEQSTTEDQNAMMLPVEIVDRQSLFTFGFLNKHLSSVQVRALCAQYHLGRVRKNQGVKLLISALSKKSPEDQETYVKTVRGMLRTKVPISQQMCLEAEIEKSKMVSAAIPLLVVSLIIAS
jgi:hypothetical protein